MRNAYQRPSQIFDVSTRDIYVPSDKPITLITKWNDYILESRVKGWLRSYMGRYWQSLDKLEKQGIVQIGDLVQLSPERLSRDFNLRSQAIQKIEEILQVSAHLQLNMNLGRKQTAVYRDGPAKRGWQY